MIPIPKCPIHKVELDPYDYGCVLRCPVCEYTIKTAELIECGIGAERRKYLNVALNPDDDVQVKP